VYHIGTASLPVVRSWRGRITDMRHIFIALIALAGSLFFWASAAHGF
jgi:hypothetical protein